MKFPKTHGHIQFRFPAVDFGVLRPIKPKVKPKHLRAVKERIELQQRHEAVRRSLVDAYHKAGDELKGRKSCVLEGELEQAFARPNLLFEVRPASELITWESSALIDLDAPYSLLSAQEQADFYDHILKNNGYPDFKRLAAKCRKTASKLERALNFLPPNTFAAVRGMVVRYQDQAMWYDIFAANPEKTGWADLKQKHPDFLRAIRSKAKYWKALIKSRSVGMSTTISLGDKDILGDNDGLEAEVALLLDDKYPPYTSTLDTSLGKGVTRLLAGAGTGSTRLARMAVSVITELVVMLNVFAAIYPKTFREVGRTLKRWPIICSPHHAFADDANKIMAQVELGKDFPFVLAAGARWDQNDEFTNVAIDLYEHLKMVRNNPARAEFLPYCSATVALPAMPNDPEVIAQSDAPHKWWKAAREAFLFSYPEPENVTCLKDLIKGKARLSPGRIAARILARLEARFLSLFGKKPEKNAGARRAKSVKRVVEAT